MAGFASGAKVIADSPILSAELCEIIVISYFSALEAV
jgi:hypothetical protein